MKSEHFFDPNKQANYGIENNYQYYSSSYLQDVFSTDVNLYCCNYYTKLNIFQPKLDAKQQKKFNEHTKLKYLNSTANAMLSIGSISFIMFIIFVSLINQANEVYTIISFSFLGFWLLLSVINMIVSIFIVNKFILFNFDHYRESYLIGIIVTSFLMLWFIPGIFLKIASKEHKSMGEIV